MFPNSSLARVAAIAVFAAAAPTLEAQAARSNTRGVMFGAHLNGSALTYEKQDAESGGGAGIALGWGFTPKLQVFLNVDAAKVDIKVDPGDGQDLDIDVGESYALVHGDIGLRYSFANPNRAFVPYISAAFSTRAATAEVLGEDVSISGPAFTVGGGIQYFFTEKLALDAGLLFSTGKFDTVKVGNVTIDGIDSETSNTTRFNIGVKFYPQIRK